MKKRVALTVLLISGAAVTTTIILMRKRRKISELIISTNKGLAHLGATENDKKTT